MSHHEREFEARQVQRLRRRIAYAEAVIHADGPTAILKARVLPSLVRALQKIQLGTYRECDVCGNEIPLTRLEAIPGAVKCIDCGKIPNVKDLSRQ